MADSIHSASKNLIDIYIEELEYKLINSECYLKFQNIINAFPEELLLKIFGFLDIKSIKNVILVNKRWYDIVTTETSTMKKLPLTIRGEILKKKHLTIGNWKFNKALFKSTDNNFDTEMLLSLKTIGSNIREIEFFQCYVSKKTVFQKIMRSFPKAEKLTFKNSFEFRYQKSIAKSLKLGNLNKIVFKQQNLMLLSCIGVQLNSFKVNILYSDIAKQTKGEVSRNEQQLMEFLYTQKRLKTLALLNICYTSEVFAKKENAVYQFKLKELSLLKIRLGDAFDDENLKDFLVTQLGSVEILELGGTFSDEIYELILNKFEKVKTLRIDISAFPDNLRFYKMIEVNKNVTKLIIDGLVSNTVQNCILLSLFPNVTDISFSSYIQFEMLSWLPKCFKVVTSLSLYSLYRGNYRNVKFSALKNLHLERVGVSNEWSDLIMCNRTIESLSFRWIFEPLNFVPEEQLGLKLKMICEMPSLKHLKFGKNIKVNLFHNRNIEDICKNLESSGFKFCCQNSSSIRNISLTHEPVWKDDME